MYGRHARRENRTMVIARRIVPVVAVLVASVAPVGCGPHPASPASPAQGR